MCKVFYWKSFQNIFSELGFFYKIYYVCIWKYESFGSNNPYAFQRRLIRDIVWDSFSFQNECFKQSNWFTGIILEIEKSFLIEIHFESNLIKLSMLQVTKIVCKITREKTFSNSHKQELKRFIFLKNKYFNYFHQYFT